MTNKERIKEIENELQRLYEDQSNIDYAGMNYGSEVYTLSMSMGMRSNLSRIDNLERELAVLKAKPVEQKESFEL